MYLVCIVHQAVNLVDRAVRVYKLVEYHLRLLVSDHPHHIEVTVDHQVEFVVQYQVERDQFELNN